MKRLFDVLVSLAGLIVAAPLMAAIAVIIKLESRGPVLYSCKRGGRFALPFGMLKFRTMVENADQVDCKLCPSGDVRVTEFGRFLRRTKLNELPQLFNVLVGDMSLVGPRPEDPKLMKVHKDKWDVVLSIRPGIVGPNQILNRNEEKLFPAGVDPEKFYMESILPEKLDRDMDYVRAGGLWKDITLLARGVYVTLFKGFSIRTISNHTRTLQWLLIDVVSSGTAYLVANWVRFESLPPAAYVIWSLIFVLSVNGVLFWTMGLYRRSVRFFSAPDLLLVTKLSLVAGAFLALFNYLVMLGTGQSRAVFVAYIVFLAVILGSTRVLARLFMERTEEKIGRRAAPQRILIYGAGRLGMGALRRLRFEPGCQVVGFVDDDPSKNGQTVAGVKVLGTGLDLAALRSLYSIDKIVVAFTSPGNKSLGEIHQRALEAGIDDVFLKTSIFDRRGSDLIAREHFRLVEFSDTIGFKPVPLKKNQLLEDLAGSSVAIVGAGDHLGSWLCNELISLGVGQIVVLEDCAARLNTISDFAESLKCEGTSIVRYFVPLAAPELVENQLASHDIQWMIYNGFNRPMSEPFLNEPAKDMMRFMDAAGFMDMAKRLGFGCFSLLSPYRKTHLPAYKKELIVLLERYLKFVARQNQIGTRYASIRLANVIEVENEIFGMAWRKASRGRHVMVPADAMHFTSAKNAAKVILNSYPLHDQGEVFVDGSSLPYDLKSLIIKYFKFSGNGANGQTLNELIHFDRREAAGENGDGILGCIETDAPSVLTLRDADVFDTTFMRTFEDTWKSGLPVRGNGTHDRIEAFLKEFQSGTGLESDGNGRCGYVA